MTAEVSAYLFGSALGHLWPLLAPLPDCRCRGWLWCSGQGKRPVAGTMTAWLQLLTLAFARPTPAGFWLTLAAGSGGQACGSAWTFASGRPGDWRRTAVSVCRGVFRLTAAQTRVVAPARRAGALTDGAGCASAPRQVTTARMLCAAARQGASGSVPPGAGRRARRAGRSGPLAPRHLPQHQSWRCRGPS
jgi:hypothetical protein